METRKLPVRLEIPRTEVRERTFWYFNSHVSKVVLVFYHCHSTRYPDYFSQYSYFTVWDTLSLLLFSNLLPMAETLGRLSSLSISGTSISGMAWTLITQATLLYDWSMVYKGSHWPIVDHIGYPNHHTWLLSHTSLRNYKDIYSNLTPATLNCCFPWVHE